MNLFRASTAVGTAFVLLALAGCSGSTPAPAADGSDSPLGKYMQSIWGGNLSEDEQVKKYEQDQKDREELIAKCMTEEGFEYIPATSTGSMSFSDGDEWKPEDAAWVAQYGYGMVRYPGSDRQAQPDDGTEYIDPNQGYVESLSESERTAYYEALSGPQPTEEEMGEDGSTYEWNWETAGCYGFAQHETEQQNPAMAEEYKPLMDAINEFYTSTAESAEFAKIDAAWSECMADAGQSGFQRQQDAQTSLSEKLNAYYENQTEWIENDPALDELAESEVALATVDLGCRQKTDYRAQQQKVSYVLEEQFLKDHKAELDALKAAVEQGQ